MKQATHHRRSGPRVGKPGSGRPSLYDPTPSPEAMAKRRQLAGRGDPNKTATLLDLLESKGLVSPCSISSKARAWLVVRSPMPADISAGCVERFTAAPTRRLWTRTWFGVTTPAKPMEPGPDAEPEAGHGGEEIELLVAQIAKGDLGTARIAQVPHASPAGESAFPLHSVSPPRTPRSSSRPLPFVAGAAP